VRHRTSGATFIKEWPAAPAGFFEAEARGLAWLTEVDGAPPVPEVVEVTAERIVIARIDEGRADAAAAEAFGQALALLHRAGPSRFGFSTDGFIGPLPLDNTESTDWPQWYAERRVLPFLRLACDRDAMSASDAATVERACTRFPDTGDPPARIHGDLWSGNVLWAADGNGWLIDAGAAHGGHRETDLAMLALFGAPHLERIVAAYDETWPLTDGWRERIPLHQLHPLLVHATLFGGGYGARATAIAAMLS
jgi:fructosamine-3-kinase